MRSTLHDAGVIKHLDGWINAVAFDAPRAVLLIERKDWDADAGAIDHSRIATDANQATPRAGANQRAKVLMPEEPREHVAARAGKPVDEHGLRSVVRTAGPDPIVLVAARPIVGDRAIEHFNEA